MIVCIIAGGSGTRLWPLSTPDYPKHLMKINGSDKSLLQHTYDRAKKVADHVYVVTEEGHAHHIKDQISELKDDNFIVEPARRGTASCIVAAVDHIASRHDKDEPIAMIHSDHFIRDMVGFAHSFKIAGECSSSEGKIVLIGVEPDHPATGFGYIKKGSIKGDSLVYEVDSFKEKPEHKVAREYTQSGKYLWNCGYFVGSANTFSEKMKKFAPDMHKSYKALGSAKNPKEYKDAYLDFENEAIDYALIEKVDDLLVVPASFDWIDVGSFNDLHKAVGEDQKGNYVGGDQKGHVELEDVDNCYIENYDDKPVAVIGLDNVVVVNTKDGLLVTRKDLGQQVGVVAKRIAKK